MQMTDIFGPLYRTMAALPPKRDPMKSLPNLSGMRLIENWISDKEAKLLLEDQIDNQIWDTTLKRRVQHYGYEYNYTYPNTKHIGQLPLWIASYAQKLYLDRVFTEKVPNQIIINEYLPGQGIASHVDCVPCFGDTIASLSLGSGCIMNISDKSGKTLDLYLKPNSLLVLKGASRYECSHGIIARRNDVIDGKRVPRQRRVSVTFRRVIDDKLAL